jgi:hypothetical protein
LISFFPRVIASALRRPRVPISSSDRPPPPEIIFTVSILLAIHSKTSRNKPPDADDDHEETLQNLLMHKTTRLHDSTQIARSKCKSRAKNTPKLQTTLDSAQIARSECKYCSKNMPEIANDAWHKLLNQNANFVPKSCEKLQPILDSAQIARSERNSFNKKLKRCLIRITVIDPIADFAHKSRENFLKMPGSAQFGRPAYKSFAKNRARYCKRCLIPNKSLDRKAKYFTQIMRVIFRKCRSLSALIVHACRSLLWTDERADRLTD